MTSQQNVITGVIPARILTIRGQKVMIDADLAELYGVPTKRLNEQVRRNIGRFPPDFMFQLTQDEKTEVVANCDHLAKLKFAKSLPFAFTEHGAIQAANVLSSLQAVEMGIYVVRAFVRLRELVTAHHDLAKRLADLEEKTEALALQQDTFAHNTRVQLKQVVEAIRQLTTPPVPPSRPIGFTTKRD
jgi:hypothetical protein